MTTLLSRMLRDRCVACQHGQGRLCQCEGAARICSGKRRRPRFEVSTTQFWWTVLIGLSGFWGVVGWRAWEAFK